MVNPKGRLLFSHLILIFADAPSYEISKKEVPKGRKKYLKLAQIAALF